MIRFNLFRGNVFIYALILVNVVGVLGYLVTNRSSTLYSNQKIQEKNIILNKTLQTKVSLATKYLDKLNSNGGDFLDSIECPSFATLSGSTIFQNLSFSGAIEGGKLICKSPTASGIPITLLYASDFRSFSVGYYYSEEPLTSGGVDVTFADPDNSRLQFITPTALTGIDGDLNSDDSTCNSKPNIPYPSGYQDDDCSPRKELYGVVRAGIGWENILWNTPEYRSAISKNTFNSTGALLPQQVSSGVLAIMTDQPVKFRFVEYNTGSYAYGGELNVKRDMKGSSLVSGVGFLAYTGSQLYLAAERSSPDVLKLDVKNSNFGLFLSFSGSNNGTGSIANAQYRVKIETSSGEQVYTNPIDDSTPGIYKYFSNEILVTENGKFLPKSSLISRATDEIIPTLDIPDNLYLCVFESSIFECMF